MKQFMYDVETLGVKSDSVILSAAIIEFDLAESVTNPNTYYQALLNRACFVKFSAEEQIRKYKRSYDMDALEWWVNQPEENKTQSFRPSSSDVLVENGFKTLHNYIGETTNEGPWFWQRGGMDQMVSEHLCVTAGIPKLAQFWLWLDVRTMIMVSKETASKGYCDIPGFDRMQVKKHNPIHDCAYDIVMMVCGK